MRQILAFFALLVCTATVWADPYGYYDLSKVTTVSETAEGKRYQFDGKYFDLIFNDLSGRALFYPVEFEDYEGQRRAAKDVANLSKMLDPLLEQHPDDQSLLLRAAKLANVGYNLDVSGMSKKTRTFYKRLLKLEPENREVNYLYGVYLAGAGKQKKSHPYLIKALELGEVNAAYSLGLSFVSIGEDAKGLKYLRQYRNAKPNDSRVDALIAAVEKQSPKLKIKTSVGSEITNLKQLNQLSRTYYLDPKPDLISGAIDVAANNGVWTGRNYLGQYSGFFNCVFHRYDKGWREKWQQQVAQLDEENRRQFNLLLEMKPDAFMAEVESSPLKNDMQWFCFFATGDTEKLRGILEALTDLDEREDLNRFLTAASARWSLARFAGKHPQVKRVVEKLREGEHEGLRSAAEDILTKSPKALKEEAAAVVVDQKKRGIW